MKLEAKLLSICGITIVAMFITSTFAYFRISSANSLTNKVITERAPVVDAGRNLRNRIMGASRSIEEDMLFGSDPDVATKLRKDYQSNWAEAEVDMDKLQALGQKYNFGKANDSIRSMKDQIVKLKAIDDHIESLIISQKPDDLATAYELTRGDMSNTEAEVFNVVNELITTQNDAQEKESKQMISSNMATIWTLWICTLLGSILGGGLSLVFARKISSSVRILVDRASAIAQGDLSGAPLDLNSSDEIGLLATAIEKMQANLRQVISTVAQTAGSVTANAVSIGNAGTDMHRKMDEQNQQTELTVAAVKEMSLSVQEVSRHANNAAENARSAAETARHGGNIVREMLSSMNSIAEAVNSTSTTIHLLGEDSQRISSIVSVIEEIANKTNLLALNAAIEAARAGEQGRGFAVVAGEVRRLAENTAQATSEISQMIDGIQKRTNTAVQSMTEGTAKVEAGMETTSRAGDALEKIIGMAEQVDQMIAQIASASQEQTTTANHSSSALHSIYQLGSENLSAMTNAVAITEELRKSALELEKQIEHFHLEDDRRRGWNSKASTARSGETSGIGKPNLALAS